MQALPIKKNNLHCRPAGACRPRSSVVAYLGARLHRLCQRYLEDAKGEPGWGEFAARKYRAWEHHLALTAAALWSAAQTKPG